MIFKKYKLFFGERERELENYFFWENFIRIILIKFLLFLLKLFSEFI